ncbi:hypothetical protein BHE74_00059887 [Ensete ventricosum]|nr:hypothetical protein BHE74_00059887 [Ensete ventricosum]
MANLQTVRGKDEGVGIREEAKRGVEGGMRERVAEKERGSEGQKTEEGEGGEGLGELGLGGERLDGGDEGGGGGG